MINRQSELARLQTVLQQARQGQGGFLLISGESGIGKTRLVQEYLGQNPGLPVLQSACHELEAGLPFAPLRSMLLPAVEMLPGQAQPSTLAAGLPTWPRRWPGAILTRRTRKRL
jgi:predicted ATPase